MKCARCKAEFSPTPNHPRQRFCRRACYQKTANEKRKAMRLRPVKKELTTLNDIYCPPIPKSWQTKPRVIFEDGRFITEAQILKKESARIYQRTRVETKYGRNQEKHRADAVRKMVEEGMNGGTW